MFRKWKNVSLAEMKQFIFLYLLTGIVTKSELNQYWSTFPLLTTSFFSNIMSQNWFQLILEFLHFNGNNKYDWNDPQKDRLFKIRPLVEYLIAKFKTAYTPHKHIEGKGRLGLKQYIPSKRARFGIKMSSVCEFSSFLSNSFVYIVKTLWRHLRNKPWLSSWGKAVLLFLSGWVISTETGIICKLTIDTLLSISLSIQLLGDIF